MDITVRKAKQDEWMLVQKLNNELFEDNASYDVHLNLLYPFSSDAIAYFKKAVKSPKFYCLLAFSGDTPVGYLIGSEKILSYRKVKSAEIIEMGVSQGYRSKGIGTQLIKVFRTWAKTKSYQTAIVRSYFANDRAQEFYKKQKLIPTDISFEGEI